MGNHGKLASLGTLAVLAAFLPHHNVSGAEGSLGSSSSVSNWVLSSLNEQVALEGGARSLSLLSELAALLLLLTHELEPALPLSLPPSESLSSSFRRRSIARSLSILG